MSYQWIEERIAHLFVAKAEDAKRSNGLRLGYSRVPAVSLLESAQ
jgi:hypothetical protein